MAEARYVLDAPEPAGRFVLEPAGAAEKPSVLEDIAKSAAVGIPKAVANVIGLPGTALDLVGRARNWAQGKLNDRPPVNYANPLPTGQEVEQKYGAPFGGLYQPQTMPGQFAQAATQGATSMPLMGVGGVAGAVAGAAAGVGGEAGGEIAGTPGAIIGSMIGGGGASLPAILARRPVQRIQEATAHMAPEQWDAAIAAQAGAANRGISVTGPEALNNRSLLATQRLVENSPASSNTMQQYMQSRGNQVQGAVGDELSKIAPAVANPPALGADVQQSAEQAINQARQSGNAAARPLYESAESQKLPATTWNSLTSEPAIQQALQVVKKNPMLGVQNETEGSVKWLDAAKKYLDESAKQAPTASALDRASSASAGRNASNIGTLVDSQVPDYGKARSIVQKNMETVVEPMQQGSTGALAGTDDPVRQFGRLADKNLSTPQTITATAKDLKMTNPTAFRDLVRNGLQNEFDSAMKVLQGSGQEFSGARFARLMRETPQTKSNIEEIIKNLPDGNIRVKAFNNLIDTLELTGNRMPTGSGTAFNSMEAKEMTSKGIPQIVEHPIRGISEMWDRFMARGTEKKLAQIFTDKESVKLMRDLAISKPGSAKGNAAISALIGTQNND